MLVVEKVQTLSDGSYFIPLEQGYGSKWQMNFSDAVYCLAAHRGLPIRTTARTVITLMSGGVVDEQANNSLRRRFMECWKAAVRRGWLGECTPDCNKAEKGNTDTLRYNYRGAKRVYIFDIPGYGAGLSTACIMKPYGYVENGWIEVIKGVDAKRLLNFLLFLEQGPGSAAQYYIPQLLKAFGDYMLKEHCHSVHPGRAATALNFLGQLGVVSIEEEFCGFNVVVLRQVVSGRELAQGETSLIYQADWLTACVEDSLRAEFARSILQLGRWADILFWRIYTDVGVFNNRQRSFLQQLIKAQAVVGARSLEDWEYIMQQVGL